MLSSDINRISPIKGYFLSIILTTFALLIRLAIAPIDAGLQYVVFFPVVTITAMLCGYGPAILSIISGIALATFIFTKPYLSLSYLSFSNALLSNIVFAADGMLVTVAIEYLHRQRRTINGLLERSREANAKLEIASLNTKRIIDNLFAYVALLDVDGNIVEINQAPLEAAGLKREDVIGQFFGDAPWWTYDSNVRAKLVEAISLAKIGKKVRYDVSVKMGESIQPIDFQISPVYDAGNNLVGLLPTGVDITARVEAEASLRIAAVAFNSLESIVITDSTGLILRVNDAFTISTGFTAEEAIGKTPRILKSGRHDDSFYKDMWDSLLATGSWQGEIWDRRKSGEIYPKLLSISAVKDNDGNISHFVGSHIDVSEQKDAENKIRSMALHDHLTMLPNRRLMLDRLRLSIASSHRSGANSALIFIDIDKFKALNDTHGHKYGDEFLVQVSKVLLNNVRETDTVSRLGGDEFVIILDNLSENTFGAIRNAKLIAEKLISALSVPFDLMEVTFSTTASLGIALYGKGKTTPDEVLKQADIAMYQAKSSGRNGLRFYDPKSIDVIRARTSFEDDLRKALDQNEFRLLYQPQVQKDRVVGAEALIRWHSPTRGIVSPAEFISIAEETGLIIPIGRWVLITACKQIDAWSRSHLTQSLTVSVNVSARQFQSKNFVSDVAEALSSSNAKPSLLKLELTESMLVNNIDFVIEKMNALKRLGVKLSLDDFGTGYSSLSYLKKMPLDQLKIDGSFIKDAPSNHNDATISKTIIQLARSLDLDVMAEGVETSEQKTFLSDSGCASYQGYLFSRPVSPDEFEKVLHESCGQFIM